MVNVGLSGQKKYHYLSQRIHVRARACFDSLELLGRRVPERSVTLKCLLRHRAGEILRDPEIGELPATSQGKHILGLKIAMDDVVVVEFLECSRHTQADLFRFLDGKTTPVASRFHVRLQIATIGELCNKCDVLIVPNEIQDMKNVRRLHPHQFVVDAHFALKGILVRRISADAF